MHYLLLSLWMVLHPVHVSITSIDLVPGTDSLKVFVKIYYDDFLKDYAGMGGMLSDVDENALNEKHILNYLGEKVKIRMNNKELKGKLLNMGLKYNELSLNLLYRPVKDSEEITIENRINASLYADQTNMVILRIGDLEEGFKLTPESSQQTFKLEKEKEISGRRK